MQNTSMDRRTFLRAGAMAGGGLFVAVYSLDAAEEIVQEVFLKVWDIACQPNPPELTRAYLYSAARNHAIRVLRHERIIRIHEEATARTVEPSKVPEIEDDLIAEEIATLVNEAVARMPEKRHQVFLLSRDRELSYAEIAAIMQISTKTVEYHMTAALRSIKTTLRDVD